SVISQIFAEPALARSNCLSHSLQPCGQYPCLSIRLAQKCRITQPSPPMDDVLTCNCLDRLLPNIQLLKLKRHECISSNIQEPLTQTSVIVHRPSSIVHPHSSRSASAGEVRPILQAGYSPASSAAAIATSNAWANRRPSSRNSSVQPNERLLITNTSTAASITPTGMASRPAVTPISPVCESTTPHSWRGVRPLARSMPSSRARSSCN